MFIKIGNGSEWPDDKKKIIRQNLQRIAQKVAKSKKAKISPTKFNLKTQNMYIKLFLKPKKTYNKPCFETAYSG